VGEEEAKIDNVIFDDALKRNPNVPLYKVVYACIFCNILICGGDHKLNMH